MIAAGFVSRYVDASLPQNERQFAENELKNALEVAYGYGLSRGQMEFASRLANEVAQKGSMTSDELLQLASKLQAR